MSVALLLWLLGISAGVLVVAMWGHSLVAGLMFAVVGALCELAGTRLLVDLARSGLLGSLGWRWLLLLLVLANAAFPGTVLFWVETVAGAVLGATVPVLLVLVIVTSGLCLVTGLIVWHTLSRRDGTVTAPIGALGMLWCAALLLAVVLRPSVLQLWFSDARTT